MARDYTAEPQPVLPQNQPFCPSSAPQVAGRLVSLLRPWCVFLLSDAAARRVDISLEMRSRFLPQDVPVSTFDDVENVNAHASS